MALELAPIATLASAITAAAEEVCVAIDSVHGLEGEEKLALDDLCDKTNGLKSEKGGRQLFLSVMAKDFDASERSTLATFTQRSDWKKAIDDLETALKETQMLLKGDPQSSQSLGDPTEAAAADAVELKSQQSTPRPVLDVLKASLGTKRPTSFLDDVKNATSQIEQCEQKIDRAIKQLSTLYETTYQPITRRSSVDTIGRIEQQMGQALDAISHAFHAHPFAILPGENNININHSTLVVLNRNNERAIEYEGFARKLGEAWVGNKMPQRTAQVRDISTLQMSLFGLMLSGLVKQLKDNRAFSSDDPEQAEFQQKLDDLEKELRKSIDRSKEQHFKIAFCGMVKAGKSSFLNALMGRSILPSNDLPATAWPCRLCHVEGQAVPELTLNTETFLTPLKKLQECQYGQKIQAYQPPSGSLIDTLFSDPPPKPSDEDVIIKMLHSQWIDLHSDTRENLLKFETPGFQLPKTAVGEEQVKKLLGQVNDIVRLCQKFGLDFDKDKADWPLLTIEFRALKGRKMDGIYEFIDLPGIGEYFPGFNFDSLVRRVASDSSAIVPIISFKEIPRSDWRCLPDLLASGGHGRANVVICTHLDQMDRGNVEDQCRTVVKTFWPGSLMDTHRVIACSSLLGLSARDLLDKSNSSKPSFKTVWNRGAVGFHCAEKLLGLANPEVNFSTINAQDWNKNLENQLTASGFPQAIEKLTCDIVDRGRINTISNDTSGIIKLLRDIGKLQCRRLLEARRTTEEFDAAKKSYYQARTEFENVLDTWSQDEGNQIQDKLQKLRISSAKIPQIVTGYIDQAIDSTLKIRGTRDIDPTDSGVLDQPEVPTRGETKALTVTSAADAEEFLRQSQSQLRSLLNSLRHQYILGIRKRAAEAMEERFEALRSAIKDLDAKQPDLQEDITDDLESYAIDPRKVGFQQLRKVIKSTPTRHTAKTAFHAIEEMIARPLLNPSSPVKGDEAETAIRERVEELNLILRVPIKMLSTVPFLLSLPIWPFIVHTRTYHLDMKVIREYYQNQILNPWVQKLNEEGEKGLTEAIKASSLVAKDSVHSALKKEDGRYEREEKKQSVNEKTTQYLISVYGNIVAAEWALKKVVKKAQDLKEESP